MHGITVEEFKLSQNEDEAVENEKNAEPDKIEEADTESLKKSDSATNVTVGMTIAGMEQELILKTLREVEGNRTKAAEILGITVRTLRNKLHEYKGNGVDVEEYLK